MWDMNRIMNQKNNIFNYLKSGFVFLPFILLTLIFPLFSEKYSYECVIIGLMIIIMLYALIWQSRRDKISGVFTPLHIFCFTYAIYFIIRPIDIIVNDKQLVDNQDFFFRTTMTYIILGLISFCFGYFSIFLDKRNHSNSQYYKNKPLIQVNVKIAIIFSFLFFLSGISIYLYLIISTGIISNNILTGGSLGQSYSEIFTMQNYLLTIAYSFVLASLLFSFGIVIVRKSIIVVTIFILQLCLTLLIVSLFGARGAIISTVFSLLVLSHFYLKKIKMRTIFLLIPLFLFFMISFELIRSGITMESTVIEAVYEYMIGTNDLMRPLLTFVGEMPEKLNFLYGSSFLQLLWQGIPRSIWGNKPVLLPVLMKDVFFPEFWKMGLSWPPSLIGELYANFHVAGIILGMSFFGFLCGNLYMKALKKFNYRWLSLYALSLYFILQELRGDFVTVTSFYILNIMPYWIVSKFVFKQSEYGEING